MKKLEKYTLVECIDTIDADLAGNANIRWSSRTKEDIACKFYKGEIYIVSSTQHAAVDISSFHDDINIVEDENGREEDDTITATFVYDPSLYSSPGVFNHFKVISEPPSGEIYTLRTTGSWSKSSSGWGSNSEWTELNPYTEHYTFNDLFKDDGDYKSSVVKTIKNGKHIIGASIDIEGYQTKTLTLSDSVLKLNIDLNSSREYNWRTPIKSNPKGYKLNKTLLILEISGDCDYDEEEEEEKPDLYSIDELSIPKGVVNLELSNVKMTNIPKLDNARISIRKCHITNLSLNNITRLDNFANITFDKCEHKFFHCGEFGTGRKKASITIFQVEEDKYVVTSAKRFITKAELSTFCSTYGLLDAMRYFDLDMNTKFKFSKDYWGTKDKDVCFDYHQDENGKIKLPYKNGTFTLNKSAGFSWYHLRFDISWKDGKIEIGEETIYGVQGETLNDVILAEVMKMSADDRFPRGFFTKFIRATNLTTSKYIGEIDVEDFQFNMMKLPEEVPHDKLVGIHYDKEDNEWIMRYWIPKTYIPRNPNYKWSQGRSEGGITESTIDWGQQTFKFKNKPNMEDSWFLNPEHTHYFEQLEKIGLDKAYLRDSYGHKIRYDETIKYKFDIDKKKLEKYGFMFLEDKMFKECDYVYSDSDSFYFKGGFYKDLSNTNGNFGGDDRLNVYTDVHSAEKLARKYGIKLDIKSIGSENRYTKIEIIAKDKFKAKYKEENNYISTIFAISDAYNKLINLQNPTAINGDSFQDTLLFKVMTPLLKIGSSLYILCNNSVYQISENNKTSTINKLNGNCESKIKFSDILRDNDFEFSFVNLVARDIIVDKIRKFIIDNREYLTSSLLPSVTLNTPYYLFRVAFYSEFRHSISGYNREESKGWTDKQKKIEKKLLEFAPEIKDMFLNTIKRLPAIETKTFKLLQINEDLELIQ